MRYKCTRCGFEMETKGSTILNFDAQCHKCKEKYGTGKFSSMKPMGEKFLKVIGRMFNVS